MRIWPVPARMAWHTSAVEVSYGATLRFARLPGSPSGGPGTARDPSRRAKTGLQVLTISRSPKCSETACDTSISRFERHAASTRTQTCTAQIRMGLTRADRGLRLKTRTCRGGQSSISAAQRGYALHIVSELCTASLAAPEDGRCLDGLEQRNDEHSGGQKGQEV